MLDFICIDFAAFSGAFGVSIFSYPLDLPTMDI